MIRFGISEAPSSMQKIILENGLKIRIGEKIDWGTFEDFMKIRSELVKEDSSLEYDLGMLRKKTIAHHTKKFFKDTKALNEFIEDAYIFFLGERHKVTFYEDVITVLEKLSSQYKLGVLTNGNADVNKIRYRPSV